MISPQEAEISGNGPILQTRRASFSHDWWGRTCQRGLDGRRNLAQGNSKIINPKIHPFYQPNQKVTLKVLYVSKY